ncbi:MAG: 4-hydroxythreonine-4-phosphate dehydrogenase PdxA [Gammaproteobacteria bacterium]|nr:4-hydroxythreonine-4-phosphate dehydrogenase PdxA [Gammaproteobacteria bacterium]
MKNSFPRILITPGEPAGIGPDITLKILQTASLAEIIVIGDPQLFLERAQWLNLPIKIIPFDDTSHSTAQQPGELKIIPVALKETCIPGHLNIANAPYVIECLNIAADLCLQKKADALVTGPIQKSIINEAGISFSGHTEFLAQRCKVKNSIMLFVVNSLKVALLTTHIPIAQVPSAITHEKLKTTIKLLQKELQTKFNITAPKIAVCGLNPHAGESGHMGSEEIEIIEPALKELRYEGIHIVGPLPADTVFLDKYLNNCDVILGMYHDQVLPVVKYLGFQEAVNVTLGLPIIRTSVDHGTALDIAGSGLADANSMAAAVKLAIELSKLSTLHEACK